MFQLHNKVFRKSISDGLFFSVLALLRSLFLKILPPSILPLPSWKSYYTSQTICGFSIKAQSDWHAIFHSCWLLLHITKLATTFYVPGFNKIKILSERGLSWNLLFSFSFMIFVICIFGNTAQRSAWFPKYLLEALKVMSSWASHKIGCEVYYCSIYWVSKTRMNLLANPIISFSWPKQTVYQISPRYLCSKDDFFFFRITRELQPCTRNHGELHVSAWQRKGAHFIKRKELGRAIGNRSTGFNLAELLPGKKECLLPFGLCYQCSGGKLPLPVSQLYLIWVSIKFFMLFRVFKCNVFYQS